MSAKDSMQLINGYPAYMRESIEKVAATRAQRIKEGSPAPMSAEGREEVCFTTHMVRYFLFYRLPDGTEERRVVEIKHKTG